MLKGSELQNLAGHHRTLNKFHHELKVRIGSDFAPGLRKLKNRLNRLMTLPLKVLKYAPKLGVASGPS